MLQRRTIVAAAAALFFLNLAPLRAAEHASANDTARFLAGMPPAPDSPLAPLTKDSSWQQHARTFDGAFERLEQRQLSRIRAWSASNLGSAPPTVYYMFSGPDFLYANAFYPNAKTYVLCALEPVGTVPDLTTLRGSVGGSLAQLRFSLSSILSYSFFITHRMKSELRVGRVNGTLPILYVFLARSGKTIREVTPVRIDDEGAVQPDVEGLRGVNSNAARGVKIVFAGDDGEARTLYYFSTNIADDGVRNSKFLKFAESLAPGGGLIKSASYLPHSGGFTKIRDFLLTNASMMVQDDSGIPLRYYDRKKWDLQPFGHYLGPIGVFPGRYQSEYAVLFRNSRPIDFGVGYRWRPGETNLLLAIKKPVDAAAEASARTTTSEEQKSEATAAQSTESSPAPRQRRRAPQYWRSPFDVFRVR
jgi:hypothetical protein